MAHQIMAERYATRIHPITVVAILSTCNGATEWTVRGDEVALAHHPFVDKTRAHRRNGIFMI